MNNESFLTRWARQKREAAAAPAAPDDTGAEAPVDLSQLPDIETLTADSDISAFLQKGVPEALQRLALRRMWSVDPAIRDFIEVAENQWDFNAAGGIPGLFQEIAPGTDVSAWLAQATQSVGVGTDEAMPGSVEPSAMPSRIAVMQHDPPSADQGPVARRDGSASTNSDASLNCAPQCQASETANELAARSKNATAPATAMRRRHGGALPR